MFKTLTTVAFAATCASAYQSEIVTKVAEPKGEIPEIFRDSTCAKKGACGDAFQACCLGYQAKGFPCTAHLIDRGTGPDVTIPAGAGDCGTAYGACCLGFKAAKQPCTCDLAMDSAVFL